MGGAHAALPAGGRAAGGGRDEPGEATRREEETSQGGSVPEGGGAAPPLAAPPGSETLARVQASSRESRLPSGTIRETVTKEIGSEGYHGLFVYVTFLFSFFLFSQLIQQF